MKFGIIFVSIVIAIFLGVFLIVHYAETPSYAGDTRGDAKGFIEEQLTHDYSYAGQWKFVSQTKSHVLGHAAWKIHYAHGKSNVCYYEWVNGYWRQHTKGQC